MKKTVLKVISAVVLTAGMVAQNVDYQLSKPEIRKKSKTFFRGFTGVNSKYIYLTNGNPITKRFYSLSVFDKNTLKKVSEKVLIGGNNSNSYSDLQLERTVFFDDTVYIFWSEKTSKSANLYVETFTAELKSIKRKTKIYSVPSDKRIDPAFFVESNKVTKKIVIGAELSRDKDENIKVEYKQLNSDLSFGTAGQFELPIKAIYYARYQTLSSQYELGDNGILYVVSAAAEIDKKGLFKITFSSKIKYILTMVNVSNNANKSVIFDLSDKKLSNVNFLYNKDKTRLLASYTDISQDEKNTNIDGFFVTAIDNDLMVLEDSKTIPLSKDILNQLAKDNNSHKKKNENSVTSDFLMSDIIPLDNGKYFLTLESKGMYAHVVNTGNSRSVEYYTYFYDVIYFMLDINNSDILWAKRIPRKEVVDGFDYKVVKNFLRNNIVYSYVPYYRDKNFEKSSQVKHNLRTFVYNIINIKSGDLETKYLEIPKTDSKDKRKFTTDDFIADDNNLYVILYHNNIPLRKALLWGSGLGTLAIAYFTNVPAMYLLPIATPIALSFVVPRQEDFVICKFTFK